MKHIFLDIETIPTQRPGALDEIRKTITPPGNIKKQETIDKWWAENGETAAEEKWRKTALDGTQGEILCIGWAGTDFGAFAEIRNTGEDEAEFLREALDKIDKFGGWDHMTRIVGHNVLNFDLRFLFQRCVVLGICPPFPLRQDTRGNGEWVYDTMLAWAGWGNRISLDNLCASLGIESPKGDGIDGSKVWDAVKTGRFDEIAEYCKRDVEAVREIYWRMTFKGRF